MAAARREVPPCACYALSQSATSDTVKIHCLVLVPTDLRVPVTRKYHTTSIVEVAMPLNSHNCCHVTATKTLLARRRPPSHPSKQSRSRCRQQTRGASSFTWSVLAALCSVGMHITPCIGVQADSILHLPTFGDLQLNIIRCDQSVTARHQFCAEVGVYPRSRGPKTALSNSREPCRQFHGTTC